MVRGLVVGGDQGRLSIADGLLVFARWAAGERDELGGWATNSPIAFTARLLTSAPGCRPSTGVPPRSECAELPWLENRLSPGVPCCCTLAVRCERKLMRLPMARVVRTVRLVRDEPQEIQSAMHDIQFSVWQYYRITTGVTPPDVLATSARSTIAFIQKLHDVLSASPSKGGIKNYSNYLTIFARRKAEGSAGAETIEAFRYLRNIGQHLVFPVVPDPGSVVGGFQGFRGYNRWAPVPLRAHNRLRPSTQKLRSFYRTRLEGCAVTDTFLTALGFFADVCPGSVHRSDEDGEWTWFPLRDQPGVTNPLHPEEPLDQVKAVRWLRRRKPGGELRVVAGQVTLGGQARLTGLTFTDDVAYSPFVESFEQVQIDIDQGYPYYVPNRMPVLEMGSGPVEIDGSTRTRITTPEPIRDLLTDPAKTAPAPRSSDWTNLGEGPQAMERMVELFIEATQRIYDLPDESFIVYRSRRLDAQFPIW